MTILTLLLPLILSFLTRTDVVTPPLYTIFNDFIVYFNSVSSLHNGESTTGSRPLTDNTGSRPVTDLCSR